MYRREYVICLLLVTDPLSVYWIRDDDPVIRQLTIVFRRCRSIRSYLSPVSPVRADYVDRHHALWLGGFSVSRQCFRDIGRPELYRISHSGFRCVLLCRGYRLRIYVAGRDVHHELRLHLFLRTVTLLTPDLFWYEVPLL